MAKITSPAGLIVGTNMTVDTVNKTIALNVGGTLVASDGVTMQAVYSKLIDLWTTTAYNKYPFGLYTIDARSGQFQVGTDGSTYNGWKFLDDTTRNMIRDAGWTEYSAAGVVDRVYVGIVALASGFPAGAQFYYQTSSSGAATDFTFTDAPNQGILVTASAGSGAAGAPFDYTTNNYFKIFCREYNYTYDDSILTDVGETKTGPYKISLPVSVSSDLNITDVDGTVSSGSPYSSIGVKFFSSPFNKDVDTTTNRAYGIVVDVGTHSGIDGSNSAGGNVLSTAAGGIVGADYIGGTVKIHSGTNKGTYIISGTPAAGAVTITGTLTNLQTGQSFTLYRATPVAATLKQIYTKVQYQLRQNSDIDNTGATVTGKTASSLIYFVGPTLVTGNGSSNPNGGGSGVMVEGIQSADVNSVELYDNTVTKRTYPYAAAGTIAFNAALVGAGSYYRMYYTDLTGVNDYGLVGAVTVNDKDGTPIQGTIGSGSIGFTYDYDGDTAGGFRTISTPTPVTVVAGRPGSAKPVVSTGTLIASKAISISLVAEGDRAYVGA